MSLSMMNCLSPASCARAPATAPPSGLLAFILSMQAGIVAPGRVARAGLAQQLLVGGEVGAADLLELVDRGRHHFGVGQHPLELLLAEREIGLGARRAGLRPRRRCPVIALTALSVAVLSACWSSGVPTPFHAAIRRPDNIRRSRRTPSWHNRRSWSPSASGCWRASARPRAARSGGIDVRLQPLFLRRIGHGDIDRRVDAAEIGGRIVVQLVGAGRVDPEQLALGAPATR